MNITLLKLGEFFSDKDTVGTSNGSEFSGDLSSMYSDQLDRYAVLDRDITGEVQGGQTT